MKGRSIDTMPLSMFYTEGICLEFYPKGLKEAIRPEDFEVACHSAGLDIREGVILYLFTLTTIVEISMERIGKMVQGLIRIVLGGWGIKEYQLLVWKQCPLVFQAIPIRMSIISVES